MNDRELLDLAAKAEGRTPKYMTEIVNGIESEPFIACWNPLKDDCDAFRLAVKLEMQVSIGFRRIDASICSDSDELAINTCEPKIGDLYAATRRAIVRAAAEIGKTIP